MLRYVLHLVAQSCLTLCNPMDCSLPDTSVHGDSPGKNTGVDCHALLQGIFPTQGSSPGLLHGRQILYRLSHHCVISKPVTEDYILNDFIYMKCPGKSVSREVDH